MALTLDGNGTITGLSAGGLPDASIVQADLAAGVAGNGPAFSAYRNGTQSLTTATFTKVQIDTEEFDTNSNFDTTTYRFTPTIAGYYQANGSINTEDSSGTITRFIANLYKNGSNYKRGVDVQSGSGIGYQATVSALVYLNGSTDYIELYAYVTGTGPALRGAAIHTYFQASLVRSA